MNQRGAAILNWNSAALFAIGAWVGYLSVRDSAPRAGGIEPLAIARSIANSGTFADPFGVATGPSAHTAPLYPFYLALVLFLFKAASAQAMALRIGSALFHGLEIGLLPAFSESAFGDTEAGFIAGLLAVAIPCYRLLPLWDTSASGLAMIGFCFCAARIETLTATRAAILGALWGLVLLLNPLIGIPTAIWAIHLARIRHWPFRGALLALGATLVICLPWTIRNYVSLGGFVPIRDNFGLELQLANNDAAASAMVQNVASIERYHPSINAPEAEKVRQEGERAYNRDKMTQALAWIGRNPLRFLELSATRALEFWFPPVSAGASPAVGMWIATLLSIPGIILASRRQAAAALPLIWMLVLSPLPQYVIQSDARYRMPFLWLSLLFAGYAVRFIGAGKDGFSFQLKRA